MENILTQSIELPSLSRPLRQLTRYTLEFLFVWVTMVDVAGGEDMPAPISTQAIAQLENGQTH